MINYNGYTVYTFENFVSLSLLLKNSQNELMKEKPNDLNHFILKIIIQNIFLFEHSHDVIFELKHLFMLTILVHITA